MPSYAIWELQKPLESSGPESPCGPTGKSRWHGSVQVKSLGEAEKQASELMRKHGWFAVGVRATGIQTGPWKYFDCSEGPTDMGLLKSRRGHSRRRKKKKEAGPGLFEMGDK